MYTNYFYLCYYFKIKEGINLKIISREEFEEAHQGERLTWHELAQKFDVSVSSIAALVRAFGLGGKGNGRGRPKQIIIKEYINKER
jgi:hypothetical protein